MSFNSSTSHESDCTLHRGKVGIPHKMKVEQLSNFDQNRVFGKTRLKFFVEISDSGQILKVARLWFDAES